MANRSHYIEIYGKELSGKINTYKVLPDLKVDVLFEKIQEDTEILMKNLQVMFKGVTLGYHCDKVLSDYRIRNYSTLSIRVTVGWEIIVKDFARSGSGKDTTYLVKPDMKMDDLFEKIASQNRFTREEIRLMHEGRMLQPYGCLSFFGIKDGSIIYLFLRQSGS